MKKFREYFTEVANYFIIAMSYILCDGLTSLLVWPIQESFLPEITIFAQLVFLPHGIRVLAAWFCGWKSLVPLIVAPLVSYIIFSPDLPDPRLAPLVLQLATVGALSAVLAFEALRLAGIDLYFGGRAELNWKLLLLVGGIAALLDAVGRVLVYGDLISQEIARLVLILVFIGDFLGQILAMLILMLLFRWLRNSRERT